MKKRLLALLTGILLLFAAQSLAEYEQYRLSEPCALYAEYITVYPLDPHNVIIRMVPYGAPWRLEWYRDGQVIRSLTAAGDYDSTSPAHPIIGKDGLLSILCRIPEEGQETEEYPPLNAAAQWTDNGLTSITPMPEHLLAARCGNRLVFYEADQYVRISYNGKDTYVSRELAGTFRIRSYSTSCIPLADEVFLIPTREDKLICLDHGDIRYKLDGSFRGREMLPDGQEGFFACFWDYPEWASERDSSPVKLVHIDRDGQQDGAYLLQGDNAVITPCQIDIHTQDNTITLYGSAADASDGSCAVFAMTLDENMAMTHLEVWNADPDYTGCDAVISLAPDGYPYVYLYDRNHSGSVRPAVVPLSVMQKSNDDYGIKLIQQR